MKAKTGVKAWLVYSAVRTVIALIQIIPIEMSLQFAKVFARGWVLLTTRHRDRAVENMKASFGDRYSPADLERMAERCLAHWTMFAMEVAWSPRLLSRTSWPRYVETVDFDGVLELLLEGRGAILVTGHYGQFEMTGYLLACLGFEVVAVMRPLDNVYLNRYIVESRRSHGLELLDKKGAMAQATAVIESGRLLAFIADQDAGSRGLFVDFFGRPASTYKSIGLLAMKTDVPIVVGYARRIGERFRYQVGVQRVIYPHEWEDKDDPLRWITQAYTIAIEETIRDEPEQYLWIHRRWKSKPGTRRSRKRRPRSKAEPATKP